MKVPILSDVILVLNYHGYKEEVINSKLHYFVDIIYKVAKLSHLEKLQSYQMEINRCFKSSSYFLTEF